jgi:hypothetical protein
MDDLFLIGQPTYKVFAKKALKENLKEELDFDGKERSTPLDLIIYKYFNHQL